MKLSLRRIHTLETVLAELQFGHAIGLLHEHQRPDADTYIKFNCENLEGYAAAEAAVAAVNSADFPRGSSGPERMRTVYVFELCRG